MSVDFLESTAEAAFVSDEKHRIVFWNRAAATLLGFEPGQVLGRRCYQVLRATDLWGNRFCSESCPLRQMVRRHEPIHAFPVQVPSASGPIQSLRCTVFAVPASRPRGKDLLHLLAPAAATDQSDETGHAAVEPTASTAASDRAPGAPVSSGCPRTLSPRETQVLDLMAAGADPTQMAALLSISPATARNHIQHILEKLEVHDRLHAIVVAHRLGLIRASSPYASDAPALGK